MAEKVLMTALSPTMDEGTIVEWKKSEGDKVNSGDLLCEVETDKATMDYESTQEGTLLKIILEDGGSANVGDPIAVLGEEGEDISGVLEEIKSSQKSGKDEGAKGSTDGEEPSGDEGEKSGGDSVSSEGEKAEAPPAEAGARVLASPLARKLAGEKGIDISRLTGSGPRGRIIKEDVENYKPSQAASASGKTVPSQDTTKPLSGKRKVMAKRLAESKFSAPHYYLKAEIDLDALLKGRSSINASIESKISLNAFMMKTAAMVLARHSAVNAGWNGDSITQFGGVHIGLAVAVDDGLLTPVVRDCHVKGLLQIDSELNGLIEKARSGKLQPDEYQGASFTISNLGMFGIDEFTAIINPPGSAILAVGAGKKVPVVGPNDEITVGNRMKVSLSCDHRVIDGAVGAAFLRDLKAGFENPYSALL